jgi:hypothetical protein
MLLQSKYYQLRRNCHLIRTGASGISWAKARFACKYCCQHAAQAHECCVDHQQSGMTEEAASPEFFSATYLGLAACLHVHRTGNAASLGSTPSHRIL